MATETATLDPLVLIGALDRSGKLSWDAGYDDDSHDGYRVITDPTEDRSDVSMTVMPYGVKIEYNHSDRFVNEHREEALSFHKNRRRIFRESGESTSDLVAGLPASGKATYLRNTLPYLIGAFKTQYPGETQLNSTLDALVAELAKQKAA